MHQETKSTEFIPQAKIQQRQSEACEQLFYSEGNKSWKRDSKERQQEPRCVCSYEGPFLPPYTSIGAYRINQMDTPKLKALGFDSRVNLWETVRFLEKPHAL